MHRLLGQCSTVLGALGREKGDPAVEWSDRLVLTRRLGAVLGAVCAGLGGTGGARVGVGGRAVAYPGYLVSQSAAMVVVEGLQAAVTCGWIHRSAGLGRAAVQSSSRQFEDT